MTRREEILPSPEPESLPPRELRRVLFGVHLWCSTRSARAVALPIAMAGASFHR
ncbi:MAG: hypothetical protein AB1486_09755 [Planctomycetota bacterium]